jgi:aryl-alcohol dehydrogenase-like predicted oxidoreductase
MQKRRLGKTEIEITPIGLGGWQFSQGANLMSGGWDNIPQAAITATVGAALDGGINWFDTAEAYGRGRSEQTLAAGLAARGATPGTVVVATKWWPVPRSARSIGATIEQRRSCLAPYPIDLYQVHWPWSFSPIAAQMKEMGKLLRAGKIRAVGVSNFSAKQMELAHAALASEGIVLASNQVRFNMLDRHIEGSGVLQGAKRLGITIIAYSPLAQGMLTGRFHDEPDSIARLAGMRRRMNGISPAGLTRTKPLIDELRMIARAHGVTIGQVALAWTVSFHGEAVVAIPGATKPTQAEQSAAALALRLSPKELERLDEVSRKVSKK